MIRPKMIQTRNLIHVCTDSLSIKYMLMKMARPGIRGTSGTLKAMDWLVKGCKFNSNMVKVMEKTKTPRDI